MLIQAIITLILTLAPSDPTPKPKPKLLRPKAIELEASNDIEPDLIDPELRALTWSLILTMPIPNPKDPNLNANPNDQNPNPNYPSPKPKPKLLRPKAT
jgi:hypothetical protein